MIAGIGIDIIEVDRIASKINQEDGFRDMVFSKNEVGYCEKKTNKFEHYAARFAAKEAFFKAIGKGWWDGTSFNEIEITHDGEGKPEMTLLNTTKEAATSLGIIKISVSLSHLKTMATAVVIIEKYS
jgi:holo-[acyl-carrier protein] synthase